MKYHSAPILQGNAPSVPDLSADNVKSCDNADQMVTVLLRSQTTRQGHPGKHLTMTTANNVSPHTAG